MSVRISKPTKTSMQSGKQSAPWLLEYISTSKKQEKLLGWTSSLDTKNQLKLYFNTPEDAIKYAKENNLDFELVENINNKIKPKSYFSNFQ
jgi:hypothetical protein